MLNLKKILTLSIFISSSTLVLAQNADSILNSIDNKTPKEPTSAAFKSTRVVFSHSSETEKKHDLDLIIRHHFGDIGGEFGSSHTLFGLDGATDLYIGLNYGISDRLTVGIGRSKQNELYNLFLKGKVIEQKSQGSPVTLTLVGQTAAITRSENSRGEFDSSGDRFSHLLQAIVARKFSSAFSLQVLPTYLIRTQVAEAGDNQNLFSLGFAGRLKFTKRMAFVADYQLVNAFGRPTNLGNTYYNPLGVGIEIETGGHVFSLNFMNSEYIIENNFIPDTRKSWRNGGVRFGFTISRNFTLFKSRNKEIETKIY